MFYSQNLNNSDEFFSKITAVDADKFESDYKFIPTHVVRFSNWFNNKDEQLEAMMYFIPSFSIFRLVLEEHFSTWDLHPSFTFDTKEKRWLQSERKMKFMEIEAIQFCESDIDRIGREKFAFIEGKKVNWVMP